MTLGNAEAVAGPVGSVRPCRGLTRATAGARSRGDLLRGPGNYVNTEGRLGKLVSTAKTDQARFLVVARHSAPAGGDVLLHISKVLQHGSRCPFRVFFSNGSV